MIVKETSRNQVEHVLVETVRQGSSRGGERGAIRIAQVFANSDSSLQRDQAVHFHQRSRNNTVQSHTKFRG